MNQQYNIGQLFDMVASDNPDKINIRLPASVLTYSNVVSLAVSFAVRMRALGIGRGSCVALDTNHQSVAAASFLGIALLGGKWVHATKNALAETRLGITHVLHDGSKPYPNQPGVVKIDQSWAAPPPGTSSNETMSFEGYSSETDTWMFCQSSGTTGTPKIMALSYRNLVDRLSTTPSDLFAGDLILAGSAAPLAFPGVMSFCRASLAGGTLVVGGDFDFWLSSSVQVVAGTPIQHVTRLEGTPAPSPDRKIPLVAVGGANASPELIKLLRQYFDDIAVVYGATESGPVSMRFLDTSEGDGNTLGRPREGVEVEVVDTDDHPVEPGAEGVVRLRTPYMVSSYLFDSEASQAAFRDGWFYPGDIGRLVDPTDELQITGRTNDQLSIGGVKVNAMVIDQALEAVPAITDGICFTEPGPQGVPVLSVVVSPSAGTDPTKAAGSIREICRTGVSRALVPTHVYFADQVPRNERGKPTRHSAPDFVRTLQRY